MSDHAFFYFPESDDEISTVDDGREPWRVDSEGRLWFRRPAHPARIFAVPTEDSVGLLARIGRWLRR